VSKHGRQGKDQKYGMFHVKRKSTTHEHIHAQKEETDGKIEFLQLNHFLTADALLEIGSAVISTVLLLD
jgi:hypothetical protein